MVKRQLHLLGYSCQGLFGDIATPGDDDDGDNESDLFSTIPASAAAFSVKTAQSEAATLFEEADSSTGWWRGVGSSTEAWKAAVQRPG